MMMERSVRDCVIFIARRALDSRLGHEHGCHCCHPADLQRICENQIVLDYFRNASRALSMWSARRWLFAFVFTVLIGFALGVVTVLIPNPYFHRDIPPTPWSYPVWIVTSVLAGMLGATYVAHRSSQATFSSSTDSNASSTKDPAPSSVLSPQDEDTRSSVWGMIGTFGAWFAIGCPVCNKLALLALGYSGAITYFAPLQPWLAAASLILLGAGLVMRLSGEIACPIPLR